jgi:hypothetical protein
MEDTHVRQNGQAYPGLLRRQAMRAMPAEALIQRPGERQRAAADGAA